MYDNLGSELSSYSCMIYNISKKKDGGKIFFCSIFELKRILLIGLSGVLLVRNEQWLVQYYYEMSNDWCSNIMKWVMIGTVLLWNE